MGGQEGGGDPRVNTGLERERARPARRVFSTFTFSFPPPHLSARERREKSVARPPSEGEHLRTKGNRVKCALAKKLFSMCAKRKVESRRKVKPVFPR